MPKFHIGIVGAGGGRRSANGKKPEVTLQDGAAAVRAALAMRESARSGGVVKV